MKEGVEYLEELLGDTYFHDRSNLNVHVENIYWRRKASYGLWRYHLVERGII